MVDKKALQTQRGTATTAGGVIGTEVASNMRRYIYKLKTSNQYNGANQLTLGYSDDEGSTSTTIDYIDHALKYDSWDEPDDLREDSLPIFIIPAGNKLYAITDNGNVYLYYEYEDAE